MSCRCQPAWNGCHGKHRPNLVCLKSLKWLLWYLLPLCKVSCFYRKVHNYLLNCPLSAGSRERARDTYIYIYIYIYTGYDNVGGRVNLNFRIMDKIEVYFKGMHLGMINCYYIEKQMLFQIELYIKWNQNMKTSQEYIKNQEYLDILKR